MSERHAVEVENLWRVYGSRGEDRAALKGIDLEIPVGTTFGLLGPNGAGKTTLCKILSTVLLPTRGSVRVFGYETKRQDRDIRREVAVAFGGERGLYGRLTVQQNLEYWGALSGLRRRKGRSRANDLMELFGLAERRSERVDKLSRGIKQRVHLARALMSTPRLLLLDEPTAGLDPVAELAFRELIREHVAPTCTILLTTHNLTEAEALSDHVALMNEGEILLRGTPTELAGAVNLRDRVIVNGPVPESLTVGDGIVAIRAVSAKETAIEVATELALTKVTRALLDAGSNRFRVVEPSLSDIYLTALGKRGMAA